ncbi:hypothetical protein HanIR_Chr10g0451071 [Helianthus annuus]|nr:hypothetical protein HanIR_Chr10g0451071 [Helianthus annuus]
MFTSIMLMKITHKSTLLFYITKNIRNTEVKITNPHFQYNLFYVFIRRIVRNSYWT